MIYKLQGSSFCCYAEKLFNGIFMGVYGYKFWLFKFCLVWICEHLIDALIGLNFNWE